MYKLILSVQLIFSLICITIQMYSICSKRWTIIETLSIDNDDDSLPSKATIYEYGFYGLWSICVLNLNDLNQQHEHQTTSINYDCYHLNQSNYLHKFITFFIIIHLLFIIFLSSIILFELIERINFDNRLKCNKTNSQKFCSNYYKNIGKILMIFHCFILNNNKNNHKQHNQRKYNENFDKTLRIRNKLYVISIAVLSTMLALFGTLKPTHLFNETQFHEIFSSSSMMMMKNYRIHRGPAFWAQITTMIMDMLITTLIVIEVRIIFVQFNNDNGGNNNNNKNDSCNSNLNQSLTINGTSTITNNDNNNNDNDDDDQYDIETVINHESIDNNFILNPFYYDDCQEMKSKNSNTNSSLTSSSKSNRLLMDTIKLLEQNVQQNTKMATASPTQTTTLNDDNCLSKTKKLSMTYGDDFYIDSENVRQMKNQRLQQQQRINNENQSIETKNISYCNPMYKEDDLI